MSPVNEVASKNRQGSQRSVLKLRIDVLPYAYLNREEVWAKSSINLVNDLPNTNFHHFAQMLVEGMPEIA